MIEVGEVSKDKVHDYLLNKHYLGRIPSISYSFGLYIDGELKGVVTIGKPSSNSLCEGICGKEYKSYVYELNRLVVDEGLPKNTLSQFVSKAIKSIKDNMILVSYADEGMKHHGYIYQATNWIYTGKTKERTDKYVPNGKHSRHYTEEYKHLRVVRTSKFRYVYFIGKMKKEFLDNLNYSILPYPKGDNSRYVLGTKMKRKVYDTNNSVEFYE